LTTKKYSRHRRRKKERKKKKEKEGEKKQHRVRYRYLVCSTTRACFIVTTSAIVMSTPTMNHDSHMEQQQQQQINEIQPAHSNSANSPHATLTRSDSTSTVILEEEETRTCRRNGPTTTPPPSLLAQLSAQLRSLLKTSGLFNKGWESSDKLNEFFASENGFTLQRLLSEVNPNDANLELNDLFKLDSTKLLDSRTLSEFLRSESFDQLLASAPTNTDALLNPPAISSSSSSFSELRSVSPGLRMETNYSYDMPTSTTSNYNQGALNAIEHDHAFLTKRTPITDLPSTSTISKRTHACGSRRTSSRIQSRAICSTTPVENKNKRIRTTNRAADIQTSDDLSYYLERRRKNNEASKMSRAARKQKFGDMDQQCEEYERVNADLRLKISTLEKVTSTLKSGLVNNFQRKN
jgi:hypothetical protein